MKKVLVLSAICANLVWGSATMFGDSTQSVSFNSEPDGATVLLDGVKKCKTPCTLSLKKNKYESVVFEKNGYQSRTMPIESSIGGAVLLNILFGYAGVFSTTSDVTNGSAYNYSPNQYYVELKKKKSDN